jgi:hypothetical protein
MHTARDTGRTRAKPDFQPAITLFRQIAAQSGAALLTEGDVHPDHKLLDLCAAALHYLVHAQKALDGRRSLAWYGLQGEEQKAAFAQDQRLHAEWQECERLGKPYLPGITKLKATTAAGIYAKAAVVRASKTGAASLAMTLAQDLLDCPGLRAILWPGEGAAE